MITSKLDRSNTRKSPCLVFSYPEWAFPESRCSSSWWRYSRRSWTRSWRSAGNWPWRRSSWAVSSKSRASSRRSRRDWWLCTCMERSPLAKDTGPLLLRRRSWLPRLGFVEQGLVKRAWTRPRGIGGGDTFLKDKKLCCLALRSLKQTRDHFGVTTYAWQASIISTIYSPETDSQSFFSTYWRQ